MDQEKIQSITLSSDLKATLEFLESHVDTETKEIMLMHQGQRTSIKKWLPIEFKYVLQTYQYQRRELIPSNYKETIALMEVLEHIEMKYQQVQRGDNTQMLVLEKTVVVTCPELSEQCAPIYNVGDMVRIYTKKLAVNTKYIGNVGNALSFEIKRRDREKIIDNTIVALMNIQKDAQIITVLEKLQQIPMEMVNYLFPDQHLDVQLHKNRENWTLDLEGIGKKHQKFIQDLCYNQYNRPYALLGIAGSGKSSALARLITSLFDNCPTIKIIVSSRNNGAIDAILLKILHRRPKIISTRYVSKKHGDELHEKLSLPHIRCDDLEDAVKKFKKGNILALTVAKCATLPISCAIADLIILDEAGCCVEYDAINLIATFLDFKKSNFVLCGDPYQLSAMSMSTHAQSLEFQRGTLARLTGLANPAYDIQEVGGSPFRSLTILNTCYRCNTTLTQQLLTQYYPFKIRAHPDEAEALKYKTLKNLPDGPMIFHHIPGIQQKYSNNCASISNPNELYWLLVYLRILIEENHLKPEEIMVLSPYKRQIEAFKKQATIKGYTVSGSEGLGIMASTPISAQGSQRAVVLLSLCQSGKRKIGKYLQDTQQNLVSSSRAFGRFILLADEIIIKQSENWSPMLKYKLDPKSIRVKFLK